MKKTDICIIQTGAIGYIENIKYLDTARYDVRFAIMDVSEESMVKIELDNKDILCKAYPFYRLDKAVNEMGNMETKYFLCGYQQEMSDTLRMQRLLIHYGVEKNNICNFTFWEEGLINYLHILKYAINRPFDFLSTGISYIENGLDIDVFKPFCGINLAQSGQDLYYSYKMAEYVLNQNHSSCKFAIIGLCPYSFEYDSSLAFSSSFYPLYYYPLFRDFKEEYSAKHILKPILDDLKYDNLLLIADEEKADLNRWFIKKNHLSSSFNRQDTLNVDREAQTLNNKNYPETIVENIRILEQYINLLNKYGIMPVFCILPFSKILKDFYIKGKIDDFRNIICAFKEKYNIFVIDLWDVNIENKYFYDLSHLNAEGATLISRVVCDAIKRGINI